MKNSNGTTDIIDVTVPETNLNKEKLNRNNRSTNCWESDLKVINKVKVIVPLKLLLVCNQIASKVYDDEFSIVTDIISKDLNSIELSENYYIPKQIVSSGSIDYLPDEYNHSVVIHRHPDGLNKFSSTDQKYINQNFELSLLYTKQDSFVNGIYNLKLEDSIIPISVEVEIQDGLEDIDISNIESNRINDFNFERLDIIQNSIAKGNTVSQKVTESELYTFDDVMNQVIELNHRIEMIEEYFYR